MKPALVISARDNVATALESLARGRVIRLGDTVVTMAEAIPRGHKVALRPIAAGEAVVKYGSPIGTASVEIAPGAHVHTHNLASARGRGDLAGTGAGRARSGQQAVAAAEPRIAEPPDTDDEPTLPERAGSR